MSVMVRTAPVPPATARRCAVALLLLVATFGFTACAGSSALTESMRSGERPAAGDAGQGNGDAPAPPSTDPAPPTPPEQAEPSPDASRDYCRRMEEFASGADGSSEDPEEVLRSLRELREVAPEDLVDDFDRVIETLEVLTSFDQDDPRSFGDLLDTLLDPGMADALGAIAERTLEECGIDIEGSGLEGFDGFEGLDGLDGLRDQFDPPGRDQPGRGERGGRGNRGRGPRG